jgi:HK97 family phage prohead protease
MKTMMSPEPTDHKVRTLLQVSTRQPLDPSPPSGSDSGGTGHLSSSPGNPQPILEFIASDESLDRYQEIVVASGWRLEAYRHNPVFQNSHQYGDVIFTLGKALVTEVRESRLFLSVEFATLVNPLAKIAYGLYQGKFLNAVSVGFIPLRWQIGTPEAGFRRKYLEQELLEVSAVGIPANPNALQLALRSGALATSDLRDLADLLVQRTEAPGPQGTDHASRIPLSLQPSVFSLLQLARDLQAILSRA